MSTVPPLEELLVLLVLLDELLLQPATARAIAAIAAVIAVVRLISSSSQLSLAVAPVSPVSRCGPHRMRAAGPVPVVYGGIPGRFPAGQPP
jgi:hypothetical protein